MADMLRQHQHLDRRSVLQVSDASEIQRLVNETIALERQIDEELEMMMGREGSEVDQAVAGLQRQENLVALQKGLDVARELSESTLDTSRLADKVSYKIRQLDVKQSRVRRALHRIDGIRDRSRAVEGLKSALERDDVDAAVGCTAQFLDLEQEEKEGGDEDGVKAEVDESRDEELEVQRTAMERYRKRCEEKVRELVLDAVEKKDHAAMTRYAAMFGPLRLEKEGVKVVVEYVTGAVGARAQADYDALVDGFSLTGAKVDYIDALTNLLKDVAESIEEHLDMLRDAFGPEYALEAVHAIHAECDVRGTRILHRFVDEKSLSKVCSQINSRTEGSSVDNTIIDSRKIEPLLTELLVLCNRGEEYIKYVLVSMADAAAPNTLSPSLETSVRGGALSSSLRELLSYYISLEEYYLEESVSKAIEIDEAVPGSLTSSMVDDSFYILLSSGKRALSTARAPSAVAILNQINTVLSTTYRTSLVHKLQGTPARLASCAPSAENPQPSTEAMSYAMAINDVDLSSVYSSKLRNQLESVSSQIFSSPHDMDRIRLVLADLNKTAADVQKLADQASEQLTTSLMSRLRPLLDAFVTSSYELLGDDGIDESWSTNVLIAFDMAFTWLQQVLSPSLFDKVMESSTDKIVSRMEAAVAQKQFTQLGGLQLEKDIRSLILGLADLTSKSMREKFSRLQQTATVLGVETALEASDLISDSNVSWRLTSLDIRQALTQRVDFSQAEVAAVRLH